MPLHDFAVAVHWVFHKPKRSCLEKGTSLRRGDEGLFPQSIETQRGEPAESERRTSNAASVKNASPSRGTRSAARDTMRECALVWQPCHPPACQGWGPPSKSTAGLITLENCTGTDHCLLTGSYFSKLCADPYGGCFVGDFSSLFNVGICW